MNARIAEFGELRWVFSSRLLPGSNSRRRVSLIIINYPNSPPSAGDDVTRLLSAWSDGDPDAIHALMPLVYNELHNIARRHWNNRDARDTLQPTALIHEAFLKLMGSSEKHFEGRKQFFALASLAMRQVLVNHAESRLALKRGAGTDDLPLETVDPAVAEEAEQVLALHEALNTLAQTDPRKSRVVELRYFGGLSIEEAAEVLDISPATVKRDWQAARAWLARQIQKGGSKPS